MGEKNTTGGTQLMGIFKRIKHIVTADMHNLLDTFEDPASMVKQYMRELEEHLDKAQQALANQLLAEQRYEALISQTEDVIVKRNRQANLAVDREEESIALLALEEKIKAEEKLHLYLEQLQIIKQQTDHLTEELKRLSVTYSELQEKKDYLLFRANTAQTIQKATETLQPYKTDTVLRGFSKMEEKIWRMETGIQAGRQARTIQNNFCGFADQASESAKRELDKLKAERKQA
jgi:phage shock protein A